MHQTILIGYHTIRNHLHDPQSKHHKLVNDLFGCDDDGILAFGEDAIEIEEDQYLLWDAVSEWGWCLTQSKTYDLDGLRTMVMEKRGELT